MGKVYWRCCRGNRRLVNFEGEISREMNQFDFLNLIFKKKIPEEFSGFNPYFLNSFLSFEKDFTFFCDAINFYTFELPKEILFKLFVIFFGGLGKFVDYEKREKKDKLEEIGNRIRKLYGWSDREFRKNYYLFKKLDLDKLSKRIGLEREDVHKFLEVIFNEERY